ncbi:unnamed protein product [Brassica rapa subsp. narinosa]
MANHQAALAAFFLFVLAVFSNFELSASSIVCGKVSCLDCHSDFDFSGLLTILLSEETCDHHGGLRPIVPVSASDRQ